MRYSFRFSGLIRYALMATVILFTAGAAAQQTVSSPVITLINPSAADSLNNSGLILVKAEIISGSPIRTYRIFNDGEPVISESGKNLKSKDSTTYIIETKLQLKKGLNIIYIEVRNGFSTSVTEKRSVFSQIEPFIRWILPSGPNTTVESAGFKLKAEIRTMLPVQNISINLNGNVLAQNNSLVTPTGNDTYVFENTIQLQPGKNNVLIACGNARGSTNSTPRSITNSFDKPPSIKLLSPSSADSLNYTGLVTVKARIESRSPVKSFRIMSDQKVLHSESGKKLMPIDSITYMFESFVALDGGINVVFVEATNSIGINVSEKRTIVSQNQPFITWLMPASENSNVESENITLRAEIKSGTLLGKTTINLNGTLITDEQARVNPPENDTYPLEKSIQLKQGRNTVFISSANTKGETISATRIINCTAGVAPSIRLISPTPDDSLNISGIVTINAEIVSKIPLQTYRIFNNKNVVPAEPVEKLKKKDSITYIVSGFVPLQIGTNAIFIDARNAAGSRISVRRNITCQLQPIIRWIMPSSNLTTSDAGSMIIKAEVITKLDLAGIKISINGSASAVEKESLKRVDNTTWVLEKSVPLYAGLNTIFIMAENARGSGNSTPRQIKYTPGVKPEIIWISPTALNSDSEKAEFLVSARITTKTPIRNTQLLVNGIAAVAGNKTKITQKNLNEFVYENTVALRSGENTIKLSASTDEESVSSGERVITYLPPALPELVWESPAPDKSIVNSPSVGLRMNIKSAASLKSISVYLNGQAIENISLSNLVKKDNNSFTLENAIALSKGDNSFYIVASNSVGMSRSDTRTLKYVVPPEPVVTANVTEVKATENKEQKAAETKEEKAAEIKPVVSIAPSAPLLAWISPSMVNNNISQNNARIRAKITSSEKIQSVLVYINGVATEAVGELFSSGTPSEYILEKGISLNPGENNIYLVATNAGGTSRSDLRYLTNPPTTPPVVSWAVPKEPKAVVNTELVMIEACIQSATELKSVQVLVNAIKQGGETFFQPPKPGDCNYKFTTPVILKEGENSVYIIAENFAGSKPSEGRVIRYEKTLIAEKRIALVFGNADYGTTNILRNPVNDANLMEATLRSLDFDVIKKTNATKTEMEAAIREFSEKLPEYNVALFYYAGHGVHVSGQNYLIPVDAKLTKQTDCQWEAVEVNKIAQQFEQVPENINILILDACRNNPFRSWSRGGDQGFKALNAVSGTFISFATSEGSTADDGAGSNGVFTEELVKQMVIAQPIEGVFKKTRKQVMERTGNRQVPADWSYLTGDFQFRK